MIRMIGFQRFLVLLILIGVVGGLAFANFSVIHPQAKKTMLELNGLQTEEARLRGEIETMKNNMEQFAQQKALYERIAQRGFFKDQDRVNAREQFNIMQRAAKVVSLKYEIRSAAMVNPEGVSDDKYSLLVSPITITVDAIDDLDIYRFIYMLTNMFPGHIAIKNIEIERPERLTTDTLKKIGTGMSVPLVRATLEVDWSTIAPKGTAPMAPGSAGGVQ